MPPEAPHDEFWQWFRGNCDRLRALLDGGDADACQNALNELFDLGSKVAPDVDLAVWGDKGGGPVQLVISADGQRERVDAVKAFVATAPMFPGWEVVAFRPRRNLADLEGITFDGEFIAPGDVWFQLEHDHGASCLALYIRGLTEENRQVRGSGAVRLAEDAIGERDFVTLIDALHAEPLPRDPARAGLRPLPELAAAVDSMREQLFQPGELQIPPERVWQLHELLIADEPAVVLFNDSLQPFAGHPNYDQRLSVHIFIRETDKNGFPATKKEYDTIAALEDQIAEALETNQESLLALKLTHKGQRVLVFYTSNAEAARNRLEPWMDSYEELEEEEDEAEDETEETEEQHNVWPQVRFDTYWSLYWKYCEGAESEEHAPEE